MGAMLSCECRTSARAKLAGKGGRHGTQSRAAGRVKVACGYGESYVSVQVVGERSEVRVREVVSASRFAMRGRRGGVVEGREVDVRVSAVSVLFDGRAHGALDAPGGVRGAEAVQPGDVRAPSRLVVDRLRLALTTALDGLERLAMLLQGPEWPVCQLRRIAAPSPSSRSSTSPPTSRSPYAACARAGGSRASWRLSRRDNEVA